DLDALRQALGAERVILVAHSYGTHLALAYIKRHGAHVERAVLGGVNGLDDRWREPIEGDRWIERVSERIGREGTLGPGYDFTARVRRVLDSFEANPAIVPLDGQQVLLGKSEIQLVVTLRSGDIEFVRSLPVLFTGLEQRTNLDGI